MSSEPKELRKMIRVNFNAVPALEGSDIGEEYISRIGRVQRDDSLNLGGNTDESFALSIGLGLFFAVEDKDISLGTGGIL